jgi:hypothetical protein
MATAGQGRIERRLAAILAADVAGYSRLTGLDEEATHAQLKDHLRIRFDRLQPGSMLVREWDGARQRVVVPDRGFAWNGETYRSLSAVAFAMTGTRWSGPRFFGLRGRMEGQS